jgi:hypothetical protein
MANSELGDKMKRGGNRQTKALTDLGAQVSKRTAQMRQRWLSEGVEEALDSAGIGELGSRLERLEAQQGEVVGALERLEAQQGEVMTALGRLEAQQGEAMTALDRLSRPAVEAEASAPSASGAVTPPVDVPTAPAAAPATDTEPPSSGPPTGPSSPGPGEEKPAAPAPRRRRDRPLRAPGH